LFFLLIPFVFLSNINLMLFPEHWTEVKGFLSSLKIGNVFPRYFHFFAASNAATGLFLVAWLGRRSFPVERKLPDFTRPEIKRIFYTLVFGFTAMQFVFGPCAFFHSSDPGVDGRGLDLGLDGGSLRPGPFAHALQRNALPGRRDWEMVLADHRIVFRDCPLDGNRAAPVSRSGGLSLNGKNDAADGRISRFGAGCADAVGGGAHRGWGSVGSAHRPVGFLSELRFLPWDGD
jgi:hypothetical protein